MQYAKVFLGAWLVIATAVLMGCGSPTRPIDENTRRFCEEAEVACRSVSLHPQPDAFHQKLEHVEELFTRVSTDDPTFSAKGKEAINKLRIAEVLIKLAHEAERDGVDSGKGWKNAEASAAEAKALIDQLK